MQQPKVDFDVVFSDTQAAGEAPLLLAVGWQVNFKHLFEELPHGISLHTEFLQVFFFLSDLKDPCFARFTLLVTVYTIIDT